MINANIQPGCNQTLPTLTMTATELDFRRLQAEWLHATNGTLVPVTYDGMSIEVAPVINRC